MLLLLSAGALAGCATGSSGPSPEWLFAQESCLQQGLASGNSPAQTRDYVDQCMTAQGYPPER
jgi:hypothetical protein